MPQPRKNCVSLDTTQYYHCTSSCVRRTFLCGIDLTTGTSYEHRRTWIEYRILALGKIFATKIHAYAVMSNHYHVVLKMDRSQALLMVFSIWLQLLCFICPWRLESVLNTFRTRKNSVKFAAFNFELLICMQFAVKMIDHFEHFYFILHLKPRDPR